VSRPKLEQKTFSPDQARKEYFPTLGRAAFYSYIKQGLIPHLRFSRKIIIPRAAMEKFLESCGAGKPGPTA
jgi:hypothetical protein